MGTYQWAAIELGFSHESAKDIAIANWVGVDAVIRVAALAVTEWAMSWHANTNMGTLLPDSRELRAYETLICLTEKKFFEKGKINDAMLQLGIALHPAQDKHGHDDYYAAAKYSLVGNIISGALKGGDGDKVDGKYERNGVTYYHFDNLIRTRDETYSMLGRFFEVYKGAITMR